MQTCKHCGDEIVDDPTGGYRHVRRLLVDARGNDRPNSEYYKGCAMFFGRVAEPA